MEVLGDVEFRGPTLKRKSFLGGENLGEKSSWEKSLKKSSSGGNLGEHISGGKTWRKYSGGKSWRKYSGGKSWRKYSVGEILEIFLGGENFFRGIFFT